VIAYAVSRDQRRDDWVAIGIHGPIPVVNAVKTPQFGKGFKFREIANIKMR